MADYIPEFCFLYCFELVPLFLFFESFKSKTMKYLLCSTGSCCWSILQQDELMLSQYDFQFCMDWHQTHQNGSLLSPPSFSTHWHNFHPTKLFKNKEGKGLPVQASCGSYPDIKDLCKSLAGDPSICHLVTSFFYVSFHLQQTNPKIRVIFIHFRIRNLKW